MKKKIIFVFPNFKPGGSQRFMINLINHLNPDQFSHKVFVFNDKGIFKSDINRDNLIKLNSNISLVRKISILIYFLKKYNPNIVFSSLGYVNILMSLIKLMVPGNIKFIGRECNIPSITNKLKRTNFLYSLAYKTIYKYLDIVICQSNDMKNDLVNNYNFNENKIKIINNGVIFNENLSKNSKYSIDKNKFNMVSVGRIEHQKGFDRLIKILSKIKDLNFQMMIIGEGSLSLDIKNMIKENHLTDKVKLLGFINNPTSIVAECDLYAMTSYREGFPNALIEALSVGIPFIAFDCLGGINEIYLNGINGWIIDNDDLNSYAMMLKSIIIDNKHKKLSKNKIIETTRNRYSISNICKQYEVVFKSI